jgi:hypothetical protein
VALVAMAAVLALVGYLMWLADAWLRADDATISLSSILLLS